MNLKYFISCIKEEIIRKDKFLNIFLRLLFNAETKVLFEYRLAKLFHGKGWKLIPYILTYRLNSRFGVYISLDATIKKGIKLPHPNGIFIGSGVCLGENCTIFQNTTLGRKSSSRQDYPIIGENVIIYTGCTIIGNVRIQDNCTIGANSLVISDTEANCTYGGNPAKKI